MPITTEGMLLVANILVVGGIVTVNVVEAVVALLLSVRGGGCRHHDLLFFNASFLSCTLKNVFCIFL